jgi:hypothetical protein
MKLQSLFPLQSVTATGGGPDTDLSTFTKKGFFSYAAINTAGSTPTLTSKLQSSPQLSRGLEQSTAGATDNKLKTGAATAVNLGCAFTQSGAHSVKRVALMLKKIGTLAAGKKLTLTLQTDSTGSPSGTILGTAGTVDIDSIVGTGYGWVVFTFATPVDLADATVYHLVLSADYTASSTNCVEWRSLTVASGGTFESYDASWNAVTTTEACEVYIDQYTFSDVSGFAFSQITAATSMSHVQKETNIHAFGSAVVRLYNTIGGTSSPAYTVGCAFLGQPKQDA